MFDFVAGPFGLAYPSPGQEQLQLVNSLYNLGVLDEPVFSLWAPANNTITSPGKLTIGGTDPSLYYGLIVWVSIIPTPQRGYEFLWLSVLDDFLINGVSTGACTSGQCTFFTDPAIGYMDIGTTAPAHVNSDCSNISELPFYTFIIGGVAFDFSPEDYVIQVGRNVKCINIPPLPNFFVRPIQGVILH